MYEAAGIGKTMLEVSKELGVSKDVVKIPPQNEF